LTLKQSLRFPCLLLIAAAIMQATNSPDSLDGLSAQVQQLTREVKTLKIELTQVILQQLAVSLGSLKRELEWLQARRAKLDRDEAGIHARMAAAREHWGQAGLSVAERRDLEELDSWGDGPGELGRISAEKNHVATREGEVNQQLHSEQRRWREVRTIGDAFAAELSTSRESGTTSR
jgi:hypothetical protein